MSNKELSQNKVLLILFLIFISMYFCKCIMSYKENFSLAENIDYRFYRPDNDCDIDVENQEEKHPKDLSVEKPLKPNERIIFTRPNKCFACEAEMLQKYTKEYINLAFPGKCISCEKQAMSEGKNPYHEGPTKCFSCSI